MVHAAQINELMKEIFSLQEERKTVGMFQFGRASELDQKIQAKRNAYTQLVKQNLDDLELHRTCERCGTKWYANAADMLGMRNRAIAVTILGAVSGNYTGAATTNEIIRKELDNANQCPNCRSTKFEEVWA